MTLQSDASSLLAPMAMAASIDGIGSTEAAVDQNLRAAQVGQVRCCAAWALVAGDISIAEFAPDPAFDCTRLTDNG